MYITKIIIENYKSFWESGEINFKKGINLIVGKNNSGKTALLEALSLNYDPKKIHKSPISLPQKNTPISKEINIELHLKIENQNINFNNEFIYHQEYNQLDEYHKSISNLLPQKDAPQLVEAKNKLEKKGQEILIILENINKAKYTDFILKSHNSKVIYFAPKELGDIPEDIGNIYQNVKTIEILQSPKTGFSLNSNTYNQSMNYTVFFALKPELKIYTFKAERLNISKFPFGNNSILASDASNLAEVLNHLQTNNPARFNRLNEFLNAVFPRIKLVSVPISIDNNFEIITWILDPKLERNDLTIPLSESGTGVGQVLAMLYVIINSETPKVIIIDEPQSFLHPSAIRTLIEIFKEYTNHQYIISTHSPVIISSSNPSTINLIRIENHESIIIPIDIQKAEDLKYSLIEVGARLSDVFGSDTIIWVEGPTEEEAFKIIISKILKEYLRGSIISSVINTGDFESKNIRNKKRIVQIYNKLSGNNSLLPPSLGFIFDREDRTTQELEDIKKLNKEKIFFTHKRLFENYLLIPEAISEHLNSLDYFSAQKITIKQIENWFNQNKWSDKYWVNIDKSKYKASQDWKMMVHGAKLLTQLYLDFSDKKIEFRKTTHSVELTKIIANICPLEFKDISDTLKKLLTANREKLSPKMKK